MLLALWLALATPAAACTADDPCARLPIPLAELPAVTIDGVPWGIARPILRLRPEVLVLDGVADARRLDLIWRAYELALGHCLRGAFGFGPVRRGDVVARVVTGRAGVIDEVAIVGGSLGSTEVGRCLADMLLHKGLWGTGWKTALELRFDAARAVEAQPRSCR